MSLKSEIFNDRSSLTDLTHDEAIEALDASKTTGGLSTWANIWKHPEMLQCTDPDCMVEHSWEIQGKTVTSKYVSPEKYMQKYHSDLIAVDNN